MNRVKLLLAGGLLLGLATLAFAQSIVQQDLEGTDTVLVQAGGPGGTGYPTTIQALRNAMGHTLVTSGTTVNTSTTNASALLLMLGATTTWNITLPQNPYTGETVEVTCPGGTVGTVNVNVLAPPAGQVIVGTAYTGCTSGGQAANNAQYTYSTSRNTWYRIQ